MSKMDGLRALREARYEQRAAGAKKPPTTARTTRQQASTSAEVKQPAATSVVPEALLCGHRSINGRTCTREQGHAAKSHRYS